MSARDDLYPHTVLDLFFCLWDAQELTRQGVGWYNAIMSTDAPAGVKKVAVERARIASERTSKPFHVLKMVEQTSYSLQLHTVFGLRPVRSSPAKEEVAV